MTSTLQAQAPVKTINPLGTDGFEFVEYTAPDQAGIDALKRLFSLMGFAEIAKHKHKHVWLYRQGDTNFIVNGEIVNGEPESQAQSFAKNHGASVNAMAFRVQDAVHAIAYAAKQGAKVVEPNVGPMELSIPAVYGIGDSLLYFVDRYGNQSIYEVDFDFYPDWQARLKEADAGLKVIDHLTHNVDIGNMDVWADFYDRIA